MHEIVHKYGLEKSHSFVRDRTRAIRKDLTLQNIGGSGAIGIYEIIARYHILCSHRLCEVIEVKQEYEQLEKSWFIYCFLLIYILIRVFPALQSLMEFYNESLHKGIKLPRESEFRAYYLLHYAHNYEVQANFERIFIKYRPELITDKKIMAAIRLRGLISIIDRDFIDSGGSAQKKKTLEPGSFESFSEIFNIISDSSFSYLMSCAFHPHIRAVRHSALSTMGSAFYILPSKPKESLTSLTWLKDVLHYDCSEELIADLENLGIEMRLVDNSVRAYIGKVKGKDANIDNDFKKENVTNSSQTFPRLSVSRQLIESKAAGYSALDIIYARDTSGRGDPAQVRANDVSTMGNNSVSAPKPPSSSDITSVSEEMSEFIQVSESTPIPTLVKTSMQDALVSSNPQTSTITTITSPELPNLGIYAVRPLSPEMEKESTLIHAAGGDITIQSDDRPLSLNPHRDLNERMEPNMVDSRKIETPDRRIMDKCEKLSNDLILDTVYEYVCEISRNISSIFLRKRQERILSNWRRLISYQAVKNALLQRERDNNRCILAISRADAPSFTQRLSIIPFSGRSKNIGSCQSLWASFDSEFTSRKINVAKTLAPIVVSRYGKRFLKDDYFSIPSHLKLVLFTPGSNTRAGRLAENWIKSSFIISSVSSSTSILQFASSKVMFEGCSIDIYAVVTHAAISQMPYQTFTDKDEEVFSGVRMVIFEFDVYDKSKDKDAYFACERGRFFRFAHMKHEITSGSNTPLPVLVVFWHAPELTVEEYRLKIVQEGDLTGVANKYALRLFWMEIPLHGTIPEIGMHSEALETNIKSMAAFISPEPKFLFLFDRIPDRDGSIFEAFLFSEFYKFVNEISKSASAKSSSTRGILAIFNIVIGAFNSILELLSTALCSQNWRTLNWPPLEFTRSPVKVYNRLSRTPVEGCELTIEFGWNSRKRLDKVLHIILSHRPTLVDTSEDKVELESSPAALKTAENMSSNYGRVFLKYSNWVSHLCRKQLIVPIASESSIQLKLMSIIRSHSKRRSDIIPFPYNEICTAIFKLIVLQLEYKLSAVDETLPYPTFAIIPAFRDCALEMDKLIRTLPDADEG